MPICSLTVRGYRSIKDIHLRLGAVNVLVGANGCGKSNLYQSVQLMAAAANGNFAQSIAEEGGMASVLWAGPRQKLSKSEAVRVRLEVELETACYELQCGLPIPSPTLFRTDPEIKLETLHGQAAARQKRPYLLERRNSSTWLRDSEGSRVAYPFSLVHSESIMAQLRDPERYPALCGVQAELRNWRFYHHFRTDREAPLKEPQVAARTAVLDQEGNKLAACLQTILESSAAPALVSAVGAAFQGASLLLDGDSTGLQTALVVPGIKRPLAARELSDGTLRYLCLLAALLGPQPPALLALNEPENSLHPDLMPHLARLIVDASQHSQMWITTHSTSLAKHLSDMSGEAPIHLEKREGETCLARGGF